LKEVLQTIEREADVTLKLKIGDEIIETTAEHPFYTQDGWKDAADLRVSDTLQTKAGERGKINSAEYSYQSKKVFNFAVADWQTYFVGAWAWLVHNVCLGLSNIFGALNSSLKHIFSSKHIAGGIMSLGKSRKEILHSVVEKIRKADTNGLLKQGPNQIKTMINGQKAEIRLFVKDGKIMSVDCFKGHSPRNMGQIITTI
jgi:hypothetical protein